MELVFFTSVTMLCILLSTLLTPACAYSLHIQVQPSTELAGKKEVQAFQLHALPRKLRLAEIEATVVGQEIQDSAPNHKQQQKQNVLAAGAKPLIHEEEEGAEVMHRSSSSGTWQEWREGDADDTSVFFTMDYSQVRRRRPIHNKSLKPNGVAVTTATP
ncbi:PREDICTED: uncharacterized protein LOC101298991 isoform X2 [Fragaria vesca subsp. vesca]|uniref:uncharacterized protein LOC101298991 isoform X2 n=1 Tax=Fragaria vesca subsp. vesca TaxID=101020 RepID=UPI0002C367E0|nr:PREDICTED: uncharacterized protein LOC101298991 isoform X2 [Fragaria vesca subsp. vesca]